MQILEWVAKKKGKLLVFIDCRFPSFKTCEDWTQLFGEPENGSYANFIREVGAIAMGSTTYEWILNHDFSEGSDRPQWAYEQPTWVFASRTLPMIEGADISFAELHYEVSRSPQRSKQR